MTTTPLMTYDEACAALHCKRTKLKELLRYGRIVRAETHGKEGLVTRASVEAELQRMAGVAVPRRARRIRAPETKAVGSIRALMPRE